MRSYWLLGAVVACLALPAQAETVKRFKVGNWEGRVSAKDDGTFAHCSASAIYNSDIRVFFFINRDFAWFMSLGHPAWNFEEGKTFDVSFTIDGLPPIRQRAKAITKSAVDLRLDDSVELFRRFKIGKKLKVQAARQEFSFNLTGTNQMLGTLLACAQARGGLSSRTAMASNPFAPPPSKASSAPTAEILAEATTLAANFLSAAGISGYRILDPKEKNGDKGHVTWLIPGGDTMGIILVLPGLDKDAQKSVGGDIIAVDAKRCTGAFMSGAMPDDKETGSARVFTMCDAGKDTSTSYYFTLPRPAGGGYLIGTTTFAKSGAVDRAKEVDENFRKAAYSFMPK